jgi:hypothetical protein
VKGSEGMLPNCYRVVGGDQRESSPGGRQTSLSQIDRSIAMLKAE